MDKNNIIKEVYDDRLTDQEAAKFFEQAYNDFHSGKLLMNPHEYLCMNFDELTALTLHGLYFTDLAKLRYEGWPDRCMRCDKKMTYGPKGCSFWTYRSKKLRGKIIKNVVVCGKCADMLAAASMRKKAMAYSKLWKKRAHRH
jgi:hypothetical protein